MKRTMEDLQGDLADIVRATAAVPDWQFIPSNDPINKYPSLDPAEDFGDPFTFLGDPLLHNLDPPIQPAGFFYNVKAAAAQDQETGIFSGGNCGNIVVGGDCETKRPSNLFSRMLHISPNTTISNMNNNAKVPAVSPFDSAVAAVGSPRVLKAHHPPPPPPTMLLSNNNINNCNLISQNSSKGCLVESPGAGLQISSPRNTGIKRRKSQAKKVVCIPAPAPANSKSSGEIVPSDLWAWRKYGQKPIKGSPYPRGYYRCSSSKGCSARKQVERSRTDPNMLVITYTSEHNHPWPTQRNALAGSTRSQPSKNCVSKNPTPPDSQNPDDDPKQEKKTEIASNPNPNSGSVKLEEMEHNFDNQLEIDEAYFEGVGFPAGTYKPTTSSSTPNNNNSQSEDSFFADLGEIEADPLDLLFTQGFCGDVDGDGRENNGLGSFGGFYNWATNDDATITSSSTATTPTTSYGEAAQRER